MFTLINISLLKVIEVIKDTKIFSDNFDYLLNIDINKSLNKYKKYTNEVIKDFVNKRNKSEEYQYLNKLQLSKDSIFTFFEYPIMNRYYISNITNTNYKSANQKLLIYNQTEKIIEAYPTENQHGYSLDISIGSPITTLSLYLDIFNSYTYILSNNIENNVCSELFDYYNKNNSNTYRVDDSISFDEKIYLKDFNLTGTPSLDEAYLDFDLINSTKINNFSFYLAERPEIKYNQTRCLSLLGGLGLGFTKLKGISFLEQLKINGVIEKKIFALLLPILNENTYLHLGGFKKSFVNDTNLIDWIDVKFVDNSTSFVKVENESVPYDIAFEDKNKNENIVNLTKLINSYNNISKNQFDDKNISNSEINENEIINYVRNKFNNLKNNFYSNNEIENIIFSSKKLPEKSFNYELNSLINNSSNNFNKKIEPNENKIFKVEKTKFEDQKFNVQQNRLNWYIPSNKLHLRNEIYEKEHKIAFNTMSSIMLIPSNFFFDNFKNIFGSETDCRIDQDGLFYCKCYPYYSDNFPIFTFELNNKFNLTITPENYVQIIINYTDDDIRPCRLLIRLNYSDDFWEFGTLVMNKYYLIFNQEDNQLGFYDRKYMDEINSNAAMLLILIVSLGSIVLFLFVYFLFKKYVERNNEPNNNNQNNQGLIV